MKKEFNFAGKVIAERNIERKVIVRDDGVISWKMVPGDKLNFYLEEDAEKEERELICLHRDIVLL